MIKTKKWIWVITAIILIALLLVLLCINYNCSRKQGTNAWKEFSAALEPEEIIIDGVIEDEKAYTIVSTEQCKDYGNLFVLFRRNSAGEWEREYTNDFMELKPWKLELGDIDGDGTIEILIAVWKTTHFDPEEKNRMFIFNYEDGKLVKKWTGSKTAGVWKDFMVGDLLPTKGEELIFVEQSENNEEHLSVYYWFDFGFVLLAESENFKNILSFTIPVENRIRMTYDKGKLIDLTVQNGKIIEEKNE